MEIILGLIGGRLYTWIELVWRGWTHWTMFVLGGICFVILGLLNEYKIPWHWNILHQAIVGACIVTIFEFFTGCIVNLWLGWQVWDYSNLPFNLMGQVCLYFFLLWVPLSAVAIVLDDWLRYLVYITLRNWMPWMKKRERPHYRICFA